MREDTAQGLLIYVEDRDGTELAVYANVSRVEYY